MEKKLATCLPPMACVNFCLGETVTCFYISLRKVKIKDYPPILGSFIVMSEYMPHPFLI